MNRTRFFISRCERRVAFAARLALLAVLTSSLGAITGCSSLIDTPSGPTPPELDVRNFYIQLATSNVVYNYTVTSNAPFHPASDTLAMKMGGVSDTVNNLPLFLCVWTYKNFGSPTNWYYGLSDKQAVNFGIENSPNNYADSWVDLQSPLALDSSWKFTSHGEQITAKIVQYGATAQVNGQTYDDVAMVDYSGDSATTGTEWFQRGKGLIYYNVNRPKLGGMVENKLISIEQ
jgi:hypothetical protein